MIYYLAVLLLCSYTLLIAARFLTFPIYIILNLKTKRIFSVVFFPRMLAIISILLMGIITVSIIYAVSRYFDDVRGRHRREFLGERFYKTKYFHDRVLRITIDDHNVPRLK